MKYFRGKYAYGKINGNYWLGEPQVIASVKSMCLCGGGVDGGQGGERRATAALCKSFVHRQRGRITAETTTSKFRSIRAVEFLQKNTYAKLQTT